MNRTVSINLDDEDAFFDPSDRLSSVVAIDLSDDDDDEFFEASRMSFAGGGASIKRVYSIAPVNNDSSSILPAYDMWMAEPGDVKERRKRLLQGMGLVSNNDLLRIASTKIVRTISIKPNAGVVEISPPVPIDSAPAPPAHQEAKSKEAEKQQPQLPLKPKPMRAVVLIRARSESDIEAFSNKTKKRKEEMLGERSKNKITRTLSGHLAPSTTGARQYSAAPIRVVKEKEERIAVPEAAAEHAASGANQHAASGANAGGGAPTQDAAAGVGNFFLIKNLDTGNDFIVKEFNEQGMWNKLNDVQTGKQLTMEEFEKSVGYSPVVKELMRRASRKGKKNNNQFSKSFRNSTKKGSAILKNLKGAASGFLVVDKMEKAAKEEKAKEEKAAAAAAKEEKSEKEEKEPAENAPAAAAEQKVEKRWPQWTDAHQHGKSVKEFTALHFSQEIQAHEGSIWTMRFSSDARFLASAGEDTNIHVWEVYECEASQPKPPEDSAPDPAAAAAEPAGDGDGEAPPNRVSLADMSTLLKKGKKTQKGSAVPDHVKLPETMVGLSEKPKYTLLGHKDEVLDLAWHQSQQLLSSSMDKTVRMWDLETQSCLKIFAHSDYVTCIQFNPVADNQFISGSLDGKLRIWSVPDRQVVDWTDVHEMLTAAANFFGDFHC